VAAAEATAILTATAAVICACATGTARLNAWAATIANPKTTMEVTINKPTESPDAWIADLLEVQNPFQSAMLCGDGISYEVYSRQDAKRGGRDYVMSRGELCEFMTNPRRWRNGFREDGTKETEWGSLVDGLTLCDTKGPLIAVAPETYPDSKTGEPKPWNWNATYCKEWRKAAEGHIIVKAAVFNEATKAVEILKADQAIHELLQCSQKQVMVQGEYQDKETGICVTVRGLLDLAPDRASVHYGDCLADLKTCNFALPVVWRRHVSDFGLDQQAALYLDLWNAATGEKRDTFRHIIQESQPPYDVSKRMLSAEFVGIGRAKYLAALKRYCACLQSGEFPGYDSDETTPPNEPIIDGWRTIAPDKRAIEQSLWL
jgi:hypothetical protein